MYRWRHTHRLTDFGQAADDDEGGEGEEEAHFGPAPVGDVDAVRGLSLDVDAAGCGRRHGPGVGRQPRQRRRVVSIRRVPGGRQLLSARGFHPDASVEQSPISCRGSSNFMISYEVRGFEKTSDFIARRRLEWQPLELNYKF